jgi:hypothetical protein
MIHRLVNDAVSRRALAVDRKPTSVRVLSTGLCYSHPTRILEFQGEGASSRYVQIALRGFFDGRFVFGSLRALLIAVAIASFALLGTYSAGI